MLGVWDASLLMLAMDVTAPLPPYEGHRLAAIEIDSSDDVATLEAMGVDLWSDRPRPGIVRVRVPPEAWPTLAASNFDVEVIEENLGPLVEEEHIRVSTDPAADHSAAFFDDYRDYDEIYEHLDALIALRPDIASDLVGGYSIEGRPIRAIEIRSPQVDAPVLLINGGQHAREWIAHATTVCIADELITRADESEIDSLLSQLTVVVAPIMNPDGYVVTWGKSRFWRKNRRNETGVDTNRNFGVAWGGPGSSPSPTAQNYRGTAAFSEPEAQALRSLALYYPTLKSHVDIHSFSQLVLFPWGWGDELAPAHETLSAISESIATVMSATHDVEYEPLMSADLYPASGNAIDWFYGSLGVYSVTIELRPSNSDPHQEGWALPPGQIREVCEETMAGIIDLAEFTIASEAGVPGDDGNADTDGWGSTGTPDAAESTGEDPSPATTADTPDPTTANGTTSTTDRGTGATTTSTPALDDDGSCGCRNSAPRSSWGGVLLLAALGRRRRRSLHRWPTREP